jgi:mercuric ion binding protein
MLRHLLAAAVAVGITSLATAASAAVRTVTLAVDNMTCATCPYTVRKSIEAVAGVSKVQVSFEAQTAVVTFDDATTTLDAVAAASTNAGYPARLLDQASQ